MQDELKQQDVQKNVSAKWSFQMLASISWIVSVLVYGSFELGDCLQLVAASAWTVSNIIDYNSPR
ncbi:MAG: hypothetical protein AAGJ10_14835 [Bacteroidota bacterium]